MIEGETAKWMEQLKELTDMPIVRVVPELHNIYTWNGSLTIHVWNSDFEIVETHTLGSGYDNSNEYEYANEIIDMIIEEHREEINSSLYDYSDDE